jgi:hypothetical protein
MPTFSSIEISTELQQRLRNEVTPPILTPHALLARDPTDTAGQLNVSLSAWNQIRHDVAKALLLRTTDYGFHHVTPMSLESQNDRFHFISSINARDLWQSLQNRDTSSLSIPHCPTLNMWLKSCNNNSMLQIIGKPSSGKTQLCLALAASFSLLSHQRVIYITTPYTTTAPHTALARRLRQLLGSESSSMQNDILSRIEFKSFDNDYQLLQGLQNMWECVSALPSCGCLLLILDSLDWNSDMSPAIRHSVQRLVHRMGLIVIAVSPECNGSTDLCLHISLEVNDDVIGSSSRIIRWCRYDDRSDETVTVFLTEQGFCESVIGTRI